MEVYPGTTTLVHQHEGFKRNITNGDYSDNIWERKNMNGEWHWKEGYLHDPGFMMNKTTFGRPPPQAPEIVPARPNPQREAFLNLPFLPAGLRGMSSQKNRGTLLQRAQNEKWIQHGHNIQQLSPKAWCSTATLIPRESKRSNPPQQDLYQERVRELPRGFKRWHMSMHWCRVKTKREALQAAIYSKGHAYNGMGPQARAMRKWQEEHSIPMRPEGSKLPGLKQCDLQRSYMRAHSSMDDPWAPILVLPC